MNITVTKNQFMTVMTSLSIGGILGACGHYIYAQKHTPEDKIREMKETKSALDLARKQAEQEAYNARADLNRLRSTKQQYQDEIRPEIEAKVRKELQTYIAQAETSYTKAKEIQEEAKKDREIAELKLELAKTLSENTKTTETIKEKIVIKSSDDDYEEDDD